MSASKKIEKKVTEDVPTEEIEKTVDEDQFLAEVINVYSVIGSGGSLRQCRVEVKKTGRTLIRAIYGPVKVGDLIQLRDCVRESRKFK
ncbi:RS28 [Enterospora canceri]|uniref:RS28 n=1 Tax=Enterospora canceri TaxID=1081671 RepID=A0A1Y1S5U6_9MICR|nr:RS28 [Enterospora canceri]